MLSLRKKLFEDVLAGTNFIDKKLHILINRDKPLVNAEDINKALRFFIIM
jgi:hypothetical protein